MASVEGRLNRVALGRPVLCGPRRLQRRSDAVEGEGDADVDDLASDSNLEDDDFKEALQDEIDAGEEKDSKRSLNDLL